MFILLTSKKGKMRRIFFTLIPPFYLTVHLNVPVRIEQVHFDFFIALKPL